MFKTIDERMYDYDISSPLDISLLKGKILKNIIVDKNREAIIFIAHDNTTYIMFHPQSCCERVEIEDICGDIEDLIDCEILVAEERVLSGEDGRFCGSSTATFYTIRTMNGSVDIRWHGESNGYYSEDVSFFAAKDITSISALVKDNIIDVCDRFNVGNKTFKKSEILFVTDIYNVDTKDGTVFEFGVLVRKDNERVVLSCISNKNNDNFASCHEYFKKWISSEY